MTKLPEYPKRDLRRMLLVLAALDNPQGSTLVKMAVESGLDKKTVTGLIKLATTQADVSIEKVGAVYRVTNWGRILKRSSAKLALTGALNAPKIEP